MVDILMKMPKMKDFPALPAKKKLEISRKIKNDIVDNYVEIGDFFRRGRYFLILQEKSHF